MRHLDYILMTTERFTDTSPSHLTVTLPGKRCTYLNQECCTKRTDHYPVTDQRPDRPASSLNAPESRSRYTTAPTANGRRHPGPGRRPPWPAAGQVWGRHRVAEVAGGRSEAQAGPGAGAAGGTGPRPGLRGPSSGGGRPGPSRHLLGAETKPHSGCAGRATGDPARRGAGSEPAGGGSGGWTAERRTEDAAGAGQRRGDPLYRKDGRFWIVDMRY